MEENDFDRSECSRVTDTRVDWDGDGASANASASASASVSASASASDSCNACDADGSVTDKTNLKRSSSLKLQRFIKLPLWNSALSFSTSASSPYVPKPGKIDSSLFKPVEGI